MWTLPRRIALAMVCAALACADRSSADDILQVCTDSCHSSFECMPASELSQETEEECVEECIPGLEHRRGLCEESFAQSRCLSTLTCEEYNEYAWVIDNANYEILHETEYPCKQEVLAYIEACS
jgi:hypothetical protein